MLVVPLENAGEASVVEAVEVIPVVTLAQAVGFFSGTLDIAPAPSKLEQWFEKFSSYDIDFGDVRGQDMAKRAIMLAAAGSHNLIMIGPPGSGEPVYTTKSRPDDPAERRIDHALVA